MKERCVHDGDVSWPGPDYGLTHVLADMLRSALEWEDTNGVHAAADKNGKDVTGPRDAGVSCPPRCGPSRDGDDRVGQGGDDDGVQGPSTDV